MEKKKTKIHCWFSPLYQPQRYWCVILHQLMDLHPIWLLKERMNKANLVLDMHSIHRQDFMFCLIMAPGWLFINRLVNNWMHGLEDMNQFWKKWLQETLTGFCIVCYFTIQSMWSILKLIANSINGLFSTQFFWSSLIRAWNICPMDLLALSIASSICGWNDVDINNFMPIILCSSCHHFKVNWDLNCVQLKTAIHVVIWFLVCILLIIETLSSLCVLVPSVLSMSFYK